MSLSLSPSPLRDILITKLKRRQPKEEEEKREKKRKKHPKGNQSSEVYIIYYYYDSTLDYDMQLLLSAFPLFVLFAAVTVAAATASITVSSSTSTGTSSSPDQTVVDDDPVGGTHYPHFTAYNDSWTCAYDEKLHVTSFNEAIRGVNLGGWMVLEPWITPSLFYQFLGTV